MKRTGLLVQDNLQPTLVSVQCYTYTLTTRFQLPNLESVFDCSSSIDVTNTIVDDVRIRVFFAIGRPALPDQNNIDVRGLVFPVNPLTDDIEDAGKETKRCVPTVMRYVTLECSPSVALTNGQNAEEYDLGPIAAPLFNFRVACTGIDLHCPKLNEIEVWSFLQTAPHNSSVSHYRLPPLYSFCHHC